MDDETDCPNSLIERLQAGEDPQSLLWDVRPLGRRTCEELAELEPATLCAAVCLNSEAHPVMASLVGAHALKLAARTQRGRNAGVAGKLAGARHARLDSD